MSVSWVQGTYLVGESDGLVMTCLEIDAVVPTEAEIWVLLFGVDGTVAISGKFMNGKV